MGARYKASSITLTEFPVADHSSPSDTAPLWSTYHMMPASITIQLFFMLAHNFSSWPAPILHGQWHSRRRLQWCVIRAQLLSFCLL